MKCKQYEIYKYVSTRQNIIPSNTKSECEMKKKGQGSKKVLHEINTFNAFNTTKRRSVNTQCAIISVHLWCGQLWISTLNCAHWTHTVEKIKKNTKQTFPPPSPPFVLSSDIVLIQLLQVTLDTFVMFKQKFGMKLSLCLCGQINRFVFDWILWTFPSVFLLFIILDVGWVKQFLFWLYLLLA